MWREISWFYSPVTLFGAAMFSWSTLPFRGGCTLPVDAARHPTPRRFFDFCSLSLSKGKSFKSKLYTCLANTLVSVSRVFYTEAYKTILCIIFHKCWVSAREILIALTAHSRINSSHCVNDVNTSRNWSHNWVEITTFKLALIHVTIRVWNMAGASFPPMVSWCLRREDFSLSTSDVICNSTLNEKAI